MSSCLVSTPNRSSDGQSAMRPPTAVRGAAAETHTPIGLLELIAILGIVEEVGEVREQIQPIARCRTRWHASRRMPTCAASRLTGCSATVRPPSESSMPPKRAISPLAIGALRNLIGRMPVAAYRHGRQRECILRCAAAVAQYAIQLSIVVGRSHGPSLWPSFDRRQEVAAGRLAATPRQTRAASLRRRR